jgi:chromosome segregation protein
MYFKKLEIFGFKSFAEKTVLNFEAGITAVVGPNGCGKSNVFDAIRWVLGEQSAKQLRGGAMEDVIFNGTDSKLALGFAEVSVTFDNHSRTLPANADEVQVTRRLFRSGESEYLINKEAVRLKDVAELFMGTGVGAEAYSLVQQGRVDLVVSARPEDRRLIFDEASGITKYKTRKKEAQGKLKDTDQNLLRINDIVVEVKRQISSIERQAQKAQRYKEEFERLKVLEADLARWQLALSSKERETVLASIARVRARDDESAAQLEEYRQILLREESFVEELESRLQDVREQAIKLESQIELASRQVAFNEERLENLSDNERRVEVSKAQVSEQCRQGELRVAEISVALDALIKGASDARVALNERKNVLMLTSASIDDLQGRIRQDEEYSLQFVSRRSGLQASLTDNMKETQGVLARRNRLETERDKIRLEKGAVDQRAQGLSQGLVDIMARRSALSLDLAREEQQQEANNSGFATLSARIEDLERRKLFLISQKDFIEKMHVQYQDIPDPVISGRFLTPVPPSRQHTGLIGKVKTVNAFAADRLEGLKSHVAGIEGTELYEVVCETKFIELDPQQIAGRIIDIGKEIEVLTAEKQQLALLISEQSRLLERIRADIFVEDKRLSVCEAQQQDVALQSAKLQTELEVLVVEAEEADQVLIRLQGAETLLKEELAGIEAETARVREEIACRQAEILVRRREREEAAVSVAQMEAEVAGVADKEKAWRANIDMYRADLQRGQRELETLDKEASGFGERREKYRLEIETLQASMAALRADRQELAVALGRHEAERDDVSQRLGSVRAQMLAIEKDVADSRDQIHGQELRIQQISFQEQSVRERILQKYQLEIASSGEQDEAPLPADFDPDKTTQDIQGLTKRCESYGTVNMVAIEEFEELRNRFQFLTKQQADLLTAKDMLEQTIRKINKTTRQMFVDTFTKVNEQFRHYFRVLFNGGEAQLVLVDPENALESGIEIVARPPGKKLQVISLLSGGEKTMTAIALIFSVFKVNPSPFCVLDEIDAALDEANVDRFAHVLKDFARIAQFIVITHNKKTIAHADVMYGVTMQQTGVSRVVSVKLSDKSQQKSEPVSDSVVDSEEAPSVAAVVPDGQADLQEELAGV